MKGAIARWEALTIPTYTRQPERRLPQPFLSGWGQTYPDKHDDILGGPKRNIDYEAIVLENEHLRVVILPQLGGKVWQVYDKHSGQDVIYTPDVIKPGLIGMPGAWIPGGMEFNFPIGHHMRTMRPLPCAVLSRGPEMASAIVRRRCGRTGMQMDVRISLKAGEARFRCDYTLLNPTPLVHGWYQWTNVGVLESPGWQFQSKAAWCWSRGGVQSYPVTASGLDISWQINRDWACDSFMVAHREDFFGYYDHDRRIGICHVAPWEKVAGKKYFTWGKRYRMYDSCNVFSDAGHNYLEIQAGPFETQSILGLFQPGEAVEFPATWIPYRDTGGIEWADADLVFNFHAGAVRVYPAVNLDFELRVNGTPYAKKLKVGQPAVIAVKLKDGDQVAIVVNGEPRRQFEWPFRGCQEPNGFQRATRELNDKPWRKPTTAKGWYDRALHALKWNMAAEAARACRKALEMNPRLHEARLLLADALWHTGEFAAGARELCSLLKTRLRNEALGKLAARARAEEDFFAPLQTIPQGFDRELATAEKLACYDNERTALRMYRRLLKRNPAHWRVLYGLACYHRYRAKNPARAARLALRALRLLPGDRDLIIECVPMLMAARQHRTAIRVLHSAPRSVRTLSICCKMLAECYLETGQLERGLEIGARYRLFNWEGESRHVDVYQDCVIGLIERALERGEPARARRLVGCLAKLPKTLGVLFREGGHAKVALWTGSVEWAAGNRDRARSLWREGVTRTLEEIAGMEKETHGRLWAGHTCLEAVYALGLCARLAGEENLVREAERVIERYRTISWGASRGRAAVSDLLDGYRHELDGDFRRASACMRKYLGRATTNLFNVRAHLAAMRKGRRRGEPAGGPDVH